MPIELTAEMLTPAMLERIKMSLQIGGGLTLLELPAGMPEPEVATVREIDIRLDGGQFVAEFTAANYDVNVLAYGGIAGVVSRVASGNLPMLDEPHPKEPYKTNLSLQNRTYCYVILKLSARNWQFSRNEDPVTLGYEATKPQEVYFSPRKVDEQGNILGRGAVQDDCKVAYFIADGAVAHGLEPDRVDPFNLHLDIMVKDSDDNPSPIPIIIDPDVRYPGGSGPS